MNTVFTIDINGLQKKIYMQCGFFDHETMSFPPHKHIIIEIHIILSCTAILNCDGEDIALNTGNVLMVPSNVLHGYETYTKTSKRITFFIDDNKYISTIKKSTFPPSFLPLVCEEIQNYTLVGSDGKLKALLSYICSDFFETVQKKPINPLSNRELVIEDFFAHKYSLPVTLDDFAKELMLSHKQTEREVKRIKGNTFVRELAKRRILAAIRLSQTTDMTLTK